VCVYVCYFGILSRAMFTFAGVRLHLVFALFRAVISGCRCGLFH
jgi:hypothetical protein